MERYKFYAAKQAVTEPLVDFIARLKELSLNCNFQSIENALRDQLVCGLRDHATRRELFREEKLTYEKAYKIAIAREKAEKDATLTDKKYEATEQEKDLHAITTKSNRNVRYVNYKDNNTRHQKAASSHETRGFITATDTEKPSRSDVTTCYCCGKKGHIGKECKHRYKVCRQCNRQGHIEAACRGQSQKVQHLQSDQSGNNDSDTSEGEPEEEVYELNNVTASDK